MNTTNQGGPSAAPIAADKIGQAFARARQEGRGALIPYFMCGYPSAEQSVKLVLAAIEGGADLIELGMPFSDPLADGATVQRAGHAALEHGMTIQGCLEIASQVAARSTVPLLLMGYYNPLLSYGLERFCEAARVHGVSGLIIPDLPAEEAGPLQETAQNNGLSLIYLVPPTTPDVRIKRIVDIVKQGHSSFIYCVSLSGVTGARDQLPPHLREFIARVRGFSEDIPLAVGVGLSQPWHIAEVSKFADGSVVGSALINLLDRLPAEEQPGAIRHFVQGLLAG